MSAITEARKWIGTPYHSGARVLGAGVDCGQLLIAAFEGAGLVPVGGVSPGVYSPEWHLHRSEEKYLGWVKKYCDEIAGDPQPGDIAVFQFGRCVSHAGIVIEWPRIIHSYVDYGVLESSVTEALLCDKTGASRLRGVYRVRGA